MCLVKDKEDRSTAKHTCILRYIQLMRLKNLQYTEALVYSANNLASSVVKGNVLILFCIFILIILYINIYYLILCLQIE